MYAVDSSSLIAYLKGEQAADTDLIAKYVTINRIAISPVVVVECLSNQRTSHLVESQLRRLYVLASDEEYWFRAALLRATVLGRGLKARTADVLIAQSCIDHDVPLITRDTDFRHFAEHGALKLAENC